CDNVKEVSKECIQFLCKKIDAVNGLFYIVDTKNEKLSLSSTYNISPRHVNHILDFDEGVFAEVLESKTAQVITSSEKKEIDFGSFKTDVVKIVTVPIISEYNNIIAIAQLSLICETDHYSDLKKVYEIMANNLLKSQKNEENEKYFNLIDKYVITSTTNKDGVINYASKAFQNISGYSEEQLLGESHNILRHPDVNIELYQDMWDTIKSGKIWIKEFQNRKKDGSTYWVESTISPEIGFYGDIVGYTAIRQDITDRKTVEELSITDALTSLYNRRHFDNELKTNLSLSQRMKTKLAFAMIDIDHFKQYNDTYGHQDGDETLKSVALTLKQFFKRDIDMVFRLGGEEFGILFYVTEFEDALKIGNQIIKCIEDLKIKHEKSSASQFVTISMGLFIYSNSDLSPLAVYKKTDELLYEAKQNGRNQFFSNI
ncbi:sensor domain-containing diguanylate cyclase, partial [Arcobacteraceae bacterium]|nr:sensor domain-containing diguanylate cyclase [Arcobacteraceae bacterium]